MVYGQIPTLGSDRRASQGLAGTKSQDQVPRPPGTQVLGLSGQVLCGKLMGRITWLI